MNRGYLGEVFLSFQGEGPLAGRKQIFLRFAGCNLSCIYCDTPRYRRRVSFCMVEGRKLRNPVSVEEVMESISSLLLPDIHSISFTGGEPLLQQDYLLSIARETKKKGWKNYLETNGFSLGRFRKVAGYFDYASIDIKLEEKIRKNAISCIDYASKRMYTIAKVVILESTDEKKFEEVCRKLPEGIKLVLQPVTPLGKLRKPSFQKLSLFYCIGSRYVEEVMVIPQIHRLLGVR
jgi:organic radical activating enzyme